MEATNVSVKDLVAQHENVPVRNKHGQFVKGVSGNPVGKPVGTKNQITQLREATELALRSYLADPAQQVKAMQAIDRVMSIAIESEDDKAAVAAFKVVADRILANVKQSEAEEGKGRGAPVLLQIVNTTGERGQRPVQVIEGDFVEVPSEE